MPLYVAQQGYIWSSQLALKTPIFGGGGGEPPNYVKNYF